MHSVKDVSRGRCDCERLVQCVRVCTGTVLLWPNTDYYEGLSCRPDWMEAVGRGGLSCAWGSGKPVSMSISQEDFDAHQ
jgi:hypothetical protein